MSQTIAQTATPRKVFRVGTVATVAAVLVLLFLIILFGVMIYFTFNNVQSLPQITVRKVYGPKFEQTAWGERKLDNFTLQAPYDIVLIPGAVGYISDKMREGFVSIDVYQGREMPVNFEVRATHIVYHPRIEASLDDPAEGKWMALAGKAADDDLVYEVKPISVSGLDGKHTTFQRVYYGQEMYVETVTACIDNRLWQVQVFYRSPGSKADVSRILNSVKIQYQGVAASRNK